MASLPELLGESAMLVALRAQIQRLVERPSADGRLPSILILGETGTGKGLLAQTIHRAGARRRGPLLDINSAAIPESLVEAELFGA